MQTWKSCSDKIWTLEDIEKYDIRGSSKSAVRSEIAAKEGQIQEEENRETEERNRTKIKEDGERRKNREQSRSVGERMMMKEFRGEEGGNLTGVKRKVGNWKNERGW